MSVLGCVTVAEARTALDTCTGPVVVIPVHDAYEDVVQCLEAVRRHSPPETAVLVVDDASTDPRLAALPDLLRDSTQRIVVLRQRENLGFVRTMNEAFAATAPCDVVLLNSDVIVGPEWLERLREAAYSDSRVATATPVTNYGTIVSVPHRNKPGELPPGFTPEQAARAVAAASSKSRPLLPTCIGHCTYIKRAAFDLAGPFDETFSPGYGEEVDFSQRCTFVGLAHVCADDVFVYHRGRGSFGISPEVLRLKEAHEELLAQRYPFYHPWVASTANGSGGLGLAIGEARRALLGLTVVVDGSCLGPVLMGTQRVTIETIRALARHPRVGKVIAVVPSPRPDYAIHALHGLAKLAIAPLEEATGSLGADVVYRPYQLYSLEALERARRWGERFVVTQLDLIFFNNPGYCPEWKTWAHYRDLVRLSLAVAEGVAFLSEHAERESRRAGLVAAGKPTKVVYNGTDHFTPDAIAPESLPPEVAARGFVLCLGTDYLHKNRMFAIRVFEQMMARGYDGHLVLAGLHVETGSSRALEAGYLLGRPELARRVVALAHVPDAARTWLYRHASLVLHPSLYEGFGLVPFEAGLAGTACLSSAQTALAEVLPPDVEVIAEWDAAVVAEQALGLIREPERRARLVAALGRRAREFSWDRTAERLMDLFDTVCRTPKGSPVAAVEGELGLIGTGQGWPPTTPAPNPLLGVFEAYPPEFQEAMRAISLRGALKRPLVSLTVLAYRLASGLRTKIVSARGHQPSDSAIRDPWP